MRDPYVFADIPLVTTAIHAGHDVRPSLAAHLALDDDARFREEDPFTDRLTGLGGRSVIVRRSRFEVDLNRPRERAVYATPEDAWGLQVWHGELPDEEIEQSLQLYDAFYAELARALDELARLGPFLVLDLHSYNHRRDGRDAPEAPPAENPEVNVGTGSLDRSRWGTLVDRFMADLGAGTARGHPLDVRENVRFRGGELSRWVNERYAGRGGALAIELKKVFMDEWTGLLDEEHLRDLGRAVGAAVPGSLQELACLARG